jgi:hypothetical protein
MSNFVPRQGVVITLELLQMLKMLFRVDQWNHLCKIWLEVSPRINVVQPVTVHYIRNTWFSVQFILSIGIYSFINRRNNHLNSREESNMSCVKRFGVLILVTKNTFQVFLLDKLVGCCFNFMFHENDFSMR